MRGERLYRGYHKLDAYERFQAFVAAEARDDAEDAERLSRSCPRRTYRQLELPFTDRLDCGTRLTLAVVGRLEVIAGRLAVVDALDEWGRCLFGITADNAEFEAFRITGEVQRSVRRAVRYQRGRFRRLPRRLRATLLADGATAAHAFARVCTEHVAVDPRDLVAAVAADYTELFDEFFAYTVDADRVDALAAVPAEGWHRCLGDGDQAKEPGT